MSRPRTDLAYRAMLVRHQLAIAARAAGEIDPEEALLAVVAPSPELQQASLDEARKAGSLRSRRRFAVAL